MANIGRRLSELVAVSHTATNHKTSTCEFLPKGEYQTKGNNMAKNAPYGDGRRVGAVKDRSQTQTPSGHYVKRDTDTGRFMDVKTSTKTPFKGVRKER